MLNSHHKIEISRQKRGDIVKVIMLEDIDGEDFGFKKGEKYKAVDGDQTDVEELKDKILVRQPNSPKKKNWWCTFDKCCIGKKIAII